MLQKRIKIKDGRYVPVQRARHVAIKELGADIRKLLRKDEILLIAPHTSITVSHLAN